MWLITAALFLVLITLLWKLGSYNHRYFDKLGIQGPRPWPFLGNLSAFIRHGFYGIDLKWKRLYGTVYGTFSGSIPVLVISDRELIRQICVKEAALFTDRFSLGVENAPLDKAITVLKGAEWKRVRSIMSPTFTGGKLKKMTPLIRDAVDILKRRFEQAAATQEDIPVKSYFSALAMDVIGRTMFGIQVNCQENPNDEFYGHAQKLFKVSFANPFLLLLSFLPGLAKYLRWLRPGGFIPADTRDYFLKTVQKALEERRKDSHPHHDFLALMLKARETADNAVEEESLEHTEQEIATDNAVSTNPTKGLTEAEMISQSFILLIAGFETTATTLQFCSYFLAKHPNYQTQCREEIRRCLGNEAPDYENVGRLQFLEQCINETLRICPPALRFDRVSTQTVKLQDSIGREITIPSGVSVQVAVHGIQNDPVIYLNPETFDPNRFTAEELDRRKRNYEFMPFGLGPRNCIGMRFAMLEIKLAMATLLANVQLVPCEKTCKLEFAASGLLQPKSPIFLRAEKLSASQ